MRLIHIVGFSQKLQQCVRGPWSLEEARRLQETPLSSCRHRRRMDRAVRAGLLTVDGKVVRGRGHRLVAGQLLCVDLTDIIAAEHANNREGEPTAADAAGASAESKVEGLGAKSRVEGFDESVTPRLLLLPNRELTPEERQRKKRSKRAARQAKLAAAARQVSNGASLYPIDDRANAAASLVKVIATEMAFPTRVGEGARRAGERLMRGFTKLASTAESHLMALPGITNEAALWGYAAFKFTPRALLLFNSLRLAETSIDAGSWRTLICIRDIVVLGAGPGNDAAGALIFRQVMAMDDPQHYIDDDGGGGQTGVRVLCTDVIPLWRCVTSVLDGCLARHIRPRPLVRHGQLDLSMGAEAAAELGEQMFEFGRMDMRPVLFCLSYVLTELRDRWQPFFETVYAAAPAGSFFFVAEPIPTQQLTLLAAHPSWVRGHDFAWIDSSLFDPTALEVSFSRLGPAVLLVLKH